ncbi:hypothetical protein BSKO_06275 [Bryopsis sp. KO-2023]|nr:hypothetical protein BSKO_06275 [Bryopsis sp. KO-2023]
MDFLMGLKGKDFVMVCSDTSAIAQIINIKHDEDKIVPVDSHKVMALSGEAGDRVQFSEYIIANIRLYLLRNGTGLSTKAVANFTRGELATALRKSPYATNLLLAGYDKGAGASLYWMDHLATLLKTNYAGTGYGADFVLSYFDQHWKKDISEEDALKLMIAGVEEVKARLVIAPSNYVIKVVDKDGTRVVKTL